MQGQRGPKQDRPRNGARAWPPAHSSGGYASGSRANRFRGVCFVSKGLDSNTFVTSLSTCVVAEYTVLGTLPLWSILRARRVAAPFPLPPLDCINHDFSTPSFHHRVAEAERTRGGGAPDRSKGEVETTAVSRRHPKKNQPALSSSMHPCTALHKKQSSHSLLGQLLWPRYDLPERRIDAAATAAHDDVVGCTTTLGGDIEDVHTYA